MPANMELLRQVCPQLISLFSSTQTEPKLFVPGMFPGLKQHHEIRITVWHLHWWTQGSMESCPLMAACSFM